MQVFVDKKGRNWTVVINVAAVQRVKAMLDVDLMDALGGKLIKKLSAESGLLCNILYVLCEKEAIERAVTDRKFGAALVGKCSVDAYCAFMAELVNFFPEGEKKKETENRRDGESEKEEENQKGACTLCTPEDLWGLVWKHAGVLGVDPNNLTLRELCLMARERKKEDWTRTSSILAQNFNMNRNPKKEAGRSPDFYNPYADKSDKTKSPESNIKLDQKTAFGLLKKIFVKPK